MNRHERKIYDGWAFAGMKDDFSRSLWPVSHAPPHLHQVFQRTNLFFTFY